MGKRKRQACCTRYQATIAGLHIGTRKLAFAEVVVARPWIVRALAEVCTSAVLKRASEGTSCAAAVSASSFPGNTYAVGTDVLEQYWDVVRSGRAVCVLRLARGCSREMKTGPSPEDASIVRIPLLICID